ERTTVDVARHVLDGWEDDLEGRWDDFSVGAHHAGAHVPVLQTMPKTSIASDDDAQDYLERCRQVDTYLAQARERLRSGLADDLTPPRRGVQATIRMLDGYLETSLDQDLLLEPVAGAGEEWRAQVADVIRDSVRPALAEHRAFLAEQVAPRARPDERSGILHLPGGEERYRRALAHHTTTDMTPEEVHELGRTIVDELEDEYRELGGRVLGADDVQAIYERLRDDEELRFDDADEVEAAAERALRKAEDAVPDWFGRLPEAPCEVRRVPELEAPDTTIAYYMPPAEDGSRPGAYYINTYEPETRTRFEAETLAFHESVPGHHLQIAIAQELELPRVRRLAFVTAYIEGWALYTERLCDEMGLYESDLSRLGMLSFDSWRACRLVVDTGLHAMGWSRQEAIDYLDDNSPQARNNIANEVDRYIAWPGQACAYMVGRREIRRLRADAQGRLGDDFDIRGFHDVVLTAGAVPLQVLASLVERWSPGG
ncbi:MAG: DUF885 domain-containing protein, partial [Nitriliruptorales bacterium]|nr:DUF885 domain-containing protein [Nitriliruptorales bacterium]